MIKASLIFATNNQHKVQEMQAAIGSQLSIVSLKEAGIDIEIPEPFDTLEQNAQEKCSVIASLVKKSCFSEDTGLEVDALNGAPGVLSARYAAEDPDFDDNISKLLFNLQQSNSRKARFRTVIALNWEGEMHFFEGICEGYILTERSGNSGFGYDPVFQPQESLKSFAEMTMDEKNIYSHRRKAADKLVLFLQQRIGLITIS